MKKYFAGILLAIWMVGGTSVAIASPERLPIKDTQKKTKERAAIAQLKNVDLRDIEDPAARRAIQEILNYLGLQAKE